MAEKKLKKKTQQPVIVSLSIEELAGSGYHVFLNAKVNGKRCRFLLDTGASKTVVDKKWFEKYVGKEKLKTIKQETTGLHSTVMESYFGKIDTLEFGKVTLKKISLAAIDLSHVNATYAKIEKKKIYGILGSDVLLKLGAIIDYKTATITIEH